MRVNMQSATTEMPIGAIAPTALATGKTTVMIPLNKLLRWARNPRKVKDPQVIENIAATIQEKGLEYPLKVLVLDPAVDAYTVYMGSTRHDAFDLLHARKVIAHDHPVECIIDDIDQETAFASAVRENVARGFFHDIDRAEAVEKMAQKKLSVQKIADTVGMQREDVHKALAVARLCDRSKALLRQNQRPYLWGFMLSKAPADLRNRILEEISDQPTSWTDAGQIRAAIAKQRIPAANALFDCAAKGVHTTGDIFESADPNNLGWIMETEKFWEHQNVAIDELRDRLEAEGHTSVEIVRGRPFINEKGYEVDANAMIRHAVITVSLDGKVDTHVNLSDPSNEADIFETQQDDAPGGTGGTDATGRVVDSRKSPTVTMPNAKAGAILLQAMTAHALDAMADDDQALRVLLAALIEDDEIRATGTARTHLQQAMRTDLVIDAKGLDPAVVKADEMRGQVDLADLPNERDALVGLLARYARSALCITNSAKAPFARGEENLLLRRVASASRSSIRDSWTPDVRLFETFDLETLRALADEVFADEAYNPAGMSKKQLVALLDDSFRSAADGTSLQEAATQARLNGWVPKYMS